MTKPAHPPDDMLLARVCAVVLAILWLLSVACPAAGQTTQPATRPAVKFPQGIVSAWYYPPIENLAAVKARGCNAVVGPELGNPPRVTVKQYGDELARLGLGLIADKKVLDAGYVPPTLIGWIVRDEPTSANHNYPPEAIAAEAAAFRAVRPDLPVICTHAGDKLTSAGGNDNALYAKYVAAVDVSLEDWYPINREVGRYWGPTQNPPLKVKALNYLKARGAAVVGSVVETSWQKLNKADPKGRAPTPDEYEQEVNESLTAGARFIIHFSTAEAGYPWPQAYDPTSPEVVARITTVNARLNPPVVVVDPVDVLKQQLADVRGELAATRADLATARADFAAGLAATRTDTAAAFRHVADAVAPAIQPTTAPSK